ncbi:MAG: NADH-quinone oxidoreductase subunit N [Planctomycetes bacterium]|nr:NADH-quinone oxidoreductase subunit N [Planctomycetota bacterium]
MNGLFTILDAPAAPAIGWDDLGGILPVLVLLATGSLALVLDLFLKEEASPPVPAGKWPLSFVSLLGTAVAGALLCGHIGAAGKPWSGFLGAVQVDLFSDAIGLIVVLGAAFCLLGAGDALRRRGIEQGEFHALVLYAAASMVLFVQSASLVMVFLSLEALSMAVYILTAFQRDEKRAVEGGLKYFVLGGLSSGFLLLGLAFIYGATRSTNLTDIAGALAGGQPPADSSLLVAGLGLTLIGLAFKVGAFPFHAWVPDAYEGAMSVVTGFMAVAVKAASFGVLLRVAVLFGGAGASGPGSPEARGALLAGISGLAVVTMIFGNLAALAQSSAKRMLAYSAIAHTGYLLVGAVSAMEARPGGEQAAGAGLLFYLFPYALMSLGAFICLSHLGEGAEDRESIDSLRGLAERHPAHALALLVIMVSFAGIPPTAGFWGKLFIFREAIATGHWELALVGILTSIVSVYYYLRLVVAMYMLPQEGGLPAPSLEARIGGKLALAIAAIAVVLVGLFPGIFFQISAACALR